MKVKLSLLAILLLLSVSKLSAQKIPLINSGQIIIESKVFYDSGNYDKAANTLLAIPERDTNYVYMLSQLAVTYLAGGKFKESIEACEKALAKPSSYRAEFLRIKATAMERNGDFDKAEALFKKALDEFPFDVSIRYNLALAYYNQKKYEQSIEELFKILSINPFHSGSHFNLGRLATLQGHKTHALFSFALYLSVNNKDNSRLVFLDKLLSNQITDEGSLPVLSKNSCEKLDQILKSKIALDKNYKTKVPMDAPVVKQTELAFEQLSILKNDGSDQWVSFYLPLFTFFKEQNLIEPFIYNMLTSANSDLISKWLKKNQKTLDVFYAAANNAISEKRKKIQVPASTGFKETASAWYYRNNKLEALGEKKEGEPVGRWQYYYENSTLSAQGDYNTGGEKIGEWKYYYDNGAIKSLENYETGEVTLYFVEGGKRQHFFLKDDEIEGIAEVFDRCGNLIDKLSYSKGLREGSGGSFYSSGKKQLTYAYKAGKRHGEFVEYYENGVVHETYQYTEGELEGEYYEYYADGKLKTKGSYKNGDVDGEWKHYYSTGAIEKTGFYKAGLAIGEWQFYTPQNVISEKRNFNAQGNWHGESTVYHLGAVYYVRTFKNDLLIKLAYYDKNGKIVSKVENNSGNFSTKIYYANGQLDGEGAYKNGRVHGLWKYYYPEGNTLSEYNYVNGEVQGKAFENYRNGKRKYDFNYKDDNYDGYFVEYYLDGKIKTEGWYQNGLRQQQWLSYASNGAVSSDYYYWDNELVKDAIDYNPANLKLSIFNYEHGLVNGVEVFINGEKNIVKKLEKDRSLFYETHYSTGKLRSRTETVCGLFTGNISRYYPGGDIVFNYTNMNGYRHGLYEYKDLNGQILTQGHYVNGNEEGEWKWYFTSGKLDTKGNYRAGVRDSLWTTYYQHGTIFSISSYVNDKREGISQYFSTEGVLMLEKLFENDMIIAYRIVDIGTGKPGEWVAFTGNAKIECKFPDGKLAYQEVYKEGFIDGDKNIYFPNGKLYSHMSFSMGDYNGAYEIYYPNGKVFDSGTYVMDDLDGTRKVYNEDGSQMLMINYELGFRHGKSIIYKKGVKDREYTFWGDLIDF